MMSPDKKSVSEMDKLLNLMDSVESGKTPPVEKTEVGESNTRPRGFSKEDEANAVKKDMNDILRNFSSALQSAESNLYESNSDDTLKQISNTSFDETTKSLSIGNYTISKSDSGFSLLDEHGTVLLKDIMLYESAYAIASYLYRGLTFNSPKVMSILNASDKYEKYISDARLNKEKYNKYKDTYDLGKLEIERSRFDENKSKARTHKKTIIEVYKRLGK